MKKFIAVAICSVMTVSHLSAQQFTAVGPWKLAVFNKESAQIVTNAADRKQGVYTLIFQCSKHKYFVALGRKDGKSTFEKGNEYLVNYRIDENEIKSSSSSAAMDTMIVLYDPPSFDDLFQGKDILFRVEISSQEIQEASFSLSMADQGLLDISKHCMPET